MQCVNGAMASVATFSKPLHWLRLFSKSDLRLLKFERNISYVVLLPEVPPDTPETNPIMKLDALPEFSLITPESCVTGVAKLSIEFETELSLHTERLPSLPKTFETVIHPLEVKTMPLNYAWKTVKNLNYVKRNEKYPKAFRRVHPNVLAAKNERWSNKILYKAVQDLRTDAEDLDEIQRRVLDVYELNARLNGIQLNEAEMIKLKYDIHNINDERTKFGDLVRKHELDFSATLTNPNDVMDMPHSLIKALAEDKTDPVRGPWTVRLHPEIYHPFMEHCPNRSARWNAWQAFYKKAGPSHGVWNTNKKRIEDLRYHRSSQAKVLGFKNYAEMSQETKMAGSVDVVLGFLENMRSFGKPVLDEQVKEMEAFAKENGFDGQTLDLHDVSFWRRLQRHSLFPTAAQEASVAEFFPFEFVFEESLKIFSRLFGLEFTRRGADEADIYHEDVRLYELVDSTSGAVSFLYVDPFARDGKLQGTWFESGRDRCSLTGTSPIGYFNCSFTPSSPGGPALLTFTDLTDLFFEMGNALQNLLTSVPYSEVSGTKNIEWDAVGVVGYFTTHLLSDYSVVRRLSRHVTTGEAMSEDLFNEVTACHHHFSCYDLLWQGLLSTFDIECYLGIRTFWLDLLKQIWPLYLPFRLDRDNFMMPCSFTQIFSEEWPAAYYSQKWSEMVAADAWSKFEETGFNLDEEQTTANGELFKATFLRLGGGVHSTEVFRRFRGNDPSTDAMLRKYRLM